MRPITSAPFSGQVEVPSGAVHLLGDLEVPAGASGIVIFAHGSGSGRHSPRNHFVARLLNAAGFATLLLDLLTEQEVDLDEKTGHLRFDIRLLAGRLADATAWVERTSIIASLPIGYFGASTGAAAALLAAARLPGRIAAIVSRGGRPDLAGAALGRVRCPTLLLVGGNDGRVIDLNQDALRRLAAPVKELVIVPHAGHLFEEPGALEEVARHAADWFERHLTAPTPAEATSEEPAPVFFRNRKQAGHSLGLALKELAHRPDVLVLALPRGGVPVAAEVAQTLGVPFDLVVVRKLGLPGHEELALGAIASGGVRVLNEDVVTALDIQPEIIEEVAEREERELQRRERTYRGNRPPPAIEGKTLVVVDDGLATGSTMRAAVLALRELHPRAHHRRRPGRPVGCVRGPADRRGRSRMSANARAVRRGRPVVRRFLADQR